MRKINRIISLIMAMLTVITMTGTDVSFAANMESGGTGNGEPVVYSEADADTVGQTDNTNCEDTESEENTENEGNPSVTADPPQTSEPAQEAVIKLGRPEYDAETNMLTLTWTGENVAYVKIYQDNELLEDYVHGTKWKAEVDPNDASDHVYYVEPYNRFDMPGKKEGKPVSVQMKVAKVKDLQSSDYDAETKKVEFSWENINADYVDILLNDVEIAKKYKKDEYTLRCELQPGAAYVLTIVPYNSIGGEGEEGECKVNTGSFEVPAKPDIRQISTPLKDKKGSYTGLSKPIMELKWDSEPYATYEVYRATKDQKTAYTWIADVKATGNEECVYKDSKVLVGTYYYKIRRKIIEDTYIDQEILTAYSETESKTIKVSAAKVKTELSGNQQIKLTVTDDKDFVSGYDIYRRDGKKSYKKIATITGNTYLDGDVQFGTTYYYKAKAFYYEAETNKTIYAPYSNSSKIKNAVGTISAVATVISADTIQLTWQPVANAEGYEVYYKSNLQGDSYALLKKTKKKSLTQKLKKGKTYLFMIKAYRTNEKGKTYFSSVELSAKTGLSNPTGFCSTETTYQWKGKELVQRDKLSWNRVYGASGYYVEYYDAKSKKYVRIANVKKSKNTSYTISNIIEKTPVTIQYRISAYSKGTVKKGETLKITPQLKEPKRVAVKQYQSGVLVSWHRATAAESYRVYRSNGRTMVLVGSTDKLYLEDKGLILGVQYTYYVQAVNTTANCLSGYSKAAEYLQLPAKVAGFTAKRVEGNGTKIQLKWSEQKEADSYIIYYATEKNGSYKKLAEVKKDKTEYVHENVQSKTTYYYRIAAVKSNDIKLKVESEYTTQKVAKSK